MSQEENRLLSDTQTSLKSLQQHDSFDSICVFVSQFLRNLSH
jgi:hypothetical protein